MAGQKLVTIATQQQAQGLVTSPSNQQNVSLVTKQQQGQGVQVKVTAGAAASPTVSVAR